MASPNSPHVVPNAGPKVVIVGAGIVGCALADELTARGWTNVVVLERGPLFATGGSTSHAPGLVFQTNPNKTMTEFAQYTVQKYASMDAFNPVGGLEVATTPERQAELERKHGWAQSWGVRSHLLTAEECAGRHPLLDPSKLYGGFHIPDDGLANAIRAAEAQAARARSRGARIVGGQPVVSIGVAGGRVRSVRTADDEWPADIVVCCAGVWGPAIGAMADVPVPLVPMAHQYAMTGPLPSLADPVKAVPPMAGRLPILRHQDRDLYFRTHGERVGIGAYGHHPMPVSVENLPSNAIQPFTEDDFEPWWREAVTLLPELADAKVESGINGIFSFTSDGMPLLGESKAVHGFWLAEAVWITHSAGVARAMAEWMVDGRPSQDVHLFDIQRFEDFQLAPAYVLDRGCQNFVEVYDIVHPLQPKEEPRPLRTSPFYVRQLELDGFCLEANGWERPHWYEANARRLRGRQIPERTDWAARYWSPIIGAEALVTRERVALFDMTPLQRMEITGKGALDFLQGLTTNQIDRPPGRVTYTLALNDDGGIRSDLTVARLDEDHFQVAGNGRLDLAWFERHAPAGVCVKDITAGTCCIGVWGPLARDLVQPMTDADFSNESFKYFNVRRAYIEHVPVTAMRVSYVGELGWELYTTADTGLRLWDSLWEAGQQFGIIAGGRGAFNSLRLEKGYRAWGADMTTEHSPDEAGLGFAVKPGKGEFVGRDALATREPRRRLVCLTSDDPRAVVMGGEPVFVDNTPQGYVTSADYGYTVGKAIAYAWLPSESAAPETPVEIGYFGARLPYTVTEEPLFDPAMSRLR